MAIYFTDENFNEEVLSSDIPVLVDFYADWCGPCKMLAPVIEALATEMEGKVKIGKLNVDDAQDIAIEYRVASIPTLMVFKGGKLADTIVGARPKEDIISLLK